MLSEGVFASAEVPPTSSVLLWLGVSVCVFVCRPTVLVPQANVMLEYPIEAAEKLLSRNLTQAESSLQQVDQDMDHIRDQCTTLEVGMWHSRCLVVHFPTTSRHGTCLQLGCEREEKEERNCSILVCVVLCVYVYPNICHNMQS